MPGIESYAVYAPRYRLSAEAISRVWRGTAIGIHSRSVLGSDEDVVTMATEAALVALSKAGIEGPDLGGIFFGTVSSPYGMKSAAAAVGDYLLAPASCWMLDVGGSAQAGLSALLLALNGAVSDRPVLVLAADALQGEPGDAAEFSYGAAAAAFVVTPNGSAARLDIALPSYDSYTFIWRTADQKFLSRHDDVRYERQAGYQGQVTAALRRALEAVGGKVDRLAVHLADAQQQAGILRSVELDPSLATGVDFVRACGDSGSANVPVNLALALDASKPGDRIVALAYSSGAGTLTALFTAGDGLSPNGSSLRMRKSVDISYDAYAKLIGILPRKGLPDGPSSWVASPGWERNKRQEVGLRGYVCKACGCMNFPERHYCFDCRGEVFEEVPLPRTGTIRSYNVQYVVSVAPEEPPIPICNVQLDGVKAEGYGGKLAALMTDCDIDIPKIGMRVELVPRRSGVELGLVRYGYKFRPLEDN